MKAVNELSELYEVIDEREDATFTLQDNHFHYQIIKFEPNPVLHLEIQECLQKLKDSKKNTTSYKTMVSVQEKLEKIMEFPNFGYLILTPAFLSLILVFMYGHYSNIQNALTQPLQEILTSLQIAYNRFTAKYKLKLLWFDDQYDYYYRNCFHLFPGGFNEFWEYVNRCMFPIYLYCPSEQGAYLSCLLEKLCSTANSSSQPYCRREDLCIPTNETLECIQEMIGKNEEITRLKDEYIAKNAPIETLFEEGISDLEYDIRVIEHNNPAFVSSTIFLILPLILTFFYALSLLIIRRVAFNQYKEGEHPLEDALSASDLNRIINLSADLKINVRNISLEKLTETLESKAEEARAKYELQFFGGDKKAGSDSNDLDPGMITISEI